MKKFNILSLSQLFLVIVLVLSLSSNVRATVYTFDLALSGQNEVPANPSTASGIMLGTFDDAVDVFICELSFSGLSTPTIAAHLHGPADVGQNGGVQIALLGFPVGVTSGTFANSFVLTPEQKSQLLCGLWYVNIHTSGYPGGEIRSQIKEGTTVGDISTFALSLTGAQEVPSNPSPANGIFMGTYDNATNTLSFDLIFNGLLGATTVSHFHGPAPFGINAGVQIPLVGFPAGVSSGTYSNSFVLTPAQEADLLNGLWYLNIHTSLYPGGEIRGQIVEGTLTGDCNVPVVPVANWALVIGGILIGAFTIFMLKKRF